MQINSNQGDLSFLKEKSDQISVALKGYLPDPKSADRSEVAHLFEMEWDYNLRGGKRLRPALCMLTNQMLGGSDEKALPTACAIELLHNFFLVHDDIEDGSELRRGKPALHLLENISHAINVGDGLFVYVWSILVKNKKVLGSSTSFKIMQEFIKQCNLTVAGQAMEIDWVKNNSFQLNERDYFDLVSRKTANYTITTPMRLGGLIAGAKTSMINSIDVPGEKLGTAFQIQDDVLNILATEKDYGKEIAGDIYEGKRTLIIIHALKHAKDHEKNKIIEILSKQRNQKTKEDVKEVLEIITNCKSVEYSQNIAKKLAEDSKRMLEKRLSAVPSSKAKSDLFSFIDFVVEREY